MPSLLAAIKHPVKNGGLYTSGCDPVRAMSQADVVWDAELLEHVDFALLENCPPAATCIIHPNGALSFCSGSWRANHRGWRGVARSRQLGSVASYF